MKQPNHLTAKSGDKFKDMVGCVHTLQKLPNFNVWVLVTELTIGVYCGAYCYTKEATGINDMDKITIHD